MLALLPAQAAALLLAACTASPPPAQEDAAREADVEVVFKGNRSLAGFRLRRVVEDLLIDFRRDPSRDTPIFDAALDLREHYVREGFPEARVDWEVVREPRLEARFRVREGHRVVVEELEIEGNEALSRTELLPLWSRRKSGFLGTGPPWFVEEELRAFAHAIAARYRSLGWLDAAVAGPFVEREPGSRRARVRLSVREGTRYTLSKVSVDPALGLDAAALGLEEAVGGPFDDLLLRSLRLKVQKQLEDAGHPDPRIRLRIEMDRGAATAAAFIEGEAGEKAYVHEVALEGHRRTSEAFIRRRLGLESDVLFHGGRVDQGVRELYMTGLFSRVQVHQEPVEEGRIRLKVELEEAEAREVAFLAGYGSYELLRGGVFLQERNLFGVGQRLSVGTRASMRGWRGDLTWTDPSIFGTRNTLSITTFAQEREEPAFTDTSTGATATLSRRLLPHVRGRFGYTFETRKGRDIDPSVGLGALEEFEEGVLFLELLRDTRNSPIFPTRGHLFGLKYEYASDELGGSLNYDRFTARAAWHAEVVEEVTLSLSAQTGLIWNRDKGLLPVQERFFNGGESTVRSFRQSRLGPRTPSGDPEGGEFRNVFNVELRFPMLPPLHGGFFFDAGNVGRRVQDFGLRDMRYAVGAGLRMLLPIGPLRLDFGFNPDPRPEERRYEVHLSVGYPF